MIVENDFTVSSANKVARRFFGLLEKPKTLMAWTHQHKLQELVAQTMKGEKMPPIYFSMGERILEAHARSIREEKHVVAVALAVNDITELQHLTRARRDFIANISHELRNPLATIQLLTDTLLRGGLEEPDTALDLVSKIAVQVDSLNQLAQEVLDLSMIESGKLPLRMSTHSLLPIVLVQKERYQTQADRKNITLTVDVDDDVTALIDETMIGRVVSNLIHNAIKFTETGGVTISAHKLNGNLPKEMENFNGDWVQVTITDTGIGISPDEQTRIFERFYKVDRARNRRETGTGLGLSIARHIIEAHGGKIWANNSPDYSGACFHFTVPTE
jgi:two-component system phosphate regulon sensor histidine kinase PhoR